ncbi:MAG TPA: creatininase family protein [Candidatus Limnocylindrales bacterium]|nr:creatininase family protein [Candidatus Limnocylindrales bacterium]
MSEKKSKFHNARKPASLRFDELTSKEVKIAAEKGTIVIFPVGSVEEHGDYLPLSADSLQPEFVALEVAKRTGCLVLPALRFGVCLTTRNFPGTLSVSFNSLYGIAFDVLNELIRNGFGKILVLSGHAGSLHMAALRLAAQDAVLRNEAANVQGKVRIMVLSDYDFAYELKGKVVSEKDGHAGAIEASRVLAINPSLVKGTETPSFTNVPRFEVLAHPENYFPKGLVGDPGEASASKGREINQYVIENVVKLVEELRSPPPRAETK